jgi:FAD-dependent oxidoreductase family protein
MFRISGVDPVKAGEAWKTVARLMDEAEAAGTHHFPRKRPIVRPQRHPSEWRANMTQLANPDGTPVDGTDVWQLTHGELTGRRQVRDAFDFIRRAVPGFEDSYIVDIAPQIGIRKTRRIVGAYQLSEDDVLGCAVFADSIGVNGWPVEAHVKGDVEIWFHRGPEGVNQLPFRMIIPRAVDNLYVAGRCASMTHGGQSAARVSGPCFAMGQAAGTAADLALKAGTSCRDVDYAQLRDRLTADGAYLGEER